MFLSCRSFNIGRVDHYHVPISVVLTNPKIGTCSGNFSINRLLVEPIIARPPTDSHGNSCLMTVAYSILSRVQLAMSFFVCGLEAPEGLYLRHSAARPESSHGKCPSSG